MDRHHKVEVPLKMHQHVSFASQYCFFQRNQLVFWIFSLYELTILLQVLNLNKIIINLTVFACNQQRCDLMQHNLRWAY